MVIFAYRSLFPLFKIVADKGFCPADLLIIAAHSKPVISQHFTIK